MDEAASGDPVEMHPVIAGASSRSPVRTTKLLRRRNATGSATSPDPRNRQQIVPGSQTTAPVSRSIVAPLSHSAPQPHNVST